jgi:aldose 1-epimerase
MLRPSASGSQHEIHFGEARAVIAQIGATLRSFQVDGQDVIDGFAPDEPASAGRGQVLAPWPNRLEDGTYSFAGHEGRAELDEPEHGNAIHGLVRWLPWTARLHTSDSIVLRCRLEAQPAYPWDLDLQIAYTLSAQGLSVSTRATNASKGLAPFGIGFHPYLTVGTESVDEARLTIPAERRLTTNERSLPTGQVPVAGTDEDFTNPRPIGPTRMDTAFTDLRRNASGRSVIRLERSDTDRAVEVWMDEDFRYVMVYTGDTLEPVGRRRRGIAIEPMTCPPNAFRSGTDVIALQPMGSWMADWGINV